MMMTSLVALGGFYTDLGVVWNLEVIVMAFDLVDSMNERVFKKYSLEPHICLVS